jgi:FAD-dependent urate hydroxylase
LEKTSLLVVGAGPYGVSVAARALERGIETIVVGRPMGFWRDNMPAGMYLRSGLDWHLDAARVHTFEAFVEEKGIPRSEIDPIPIAVFLEYAAWFQEQKRVAVRDSFVTHVARRDGAFVARLDDGNEIAAERLVAAPGVAYFQHLPDWAASVPPGTAAHTCALTRFDELAGARALIVGGRQSAYEWAALIGEHGAQRVDIVHRHPVPRFERVSWAFVDPYVDATLNSRGWWRSLPGAQQEAIARQFWEVGRLTLEWWLTPRLRGDRFHRWPGTEVVDAKPLSSNGTVRVALSNGETFTVDRIVFATGYKVELARVPYLEGLISELKVSDGSPVLDEAFQSSVPGLYLPGMAAARDFGPFFGFTKACPVAASLIVDDVSRAL